MTESSFNLEPIGLLHSELVNRKGAPRQGFEGAPDAWLEMSPAFVEAMEGLAVGDSVIIVTWLHKANRSTLKTHPRNDQTAPLRGVFATRSPDRPNPLGLHRVTILEIIGNRLKVGPIEAIHGTPVVDIKPVLKQSADA